MTQMDLLERMAQDARDKAIEKVSLNNDSFMERALKMISHLRAQMHLMDREFTGEDIREHLISWKIEPAHSNAYGALIMTAVKRGLIVGTGKYVSMKSAKSHARKTQLYRWG